jgi:hypothetical protein
MALAADETSQSARKTSAPVTCLNVTRKGTASRIWKLGAQVKINLRSAFDVRRAQKQSAARFYAERQTLNAERERSGPAVRENFRQELLGAFGSG